MENRRTPDRTFETFPLNTSGDVFGPLEGFVTLWKTKHDARGDLPIWRDFDIMDFEGWWGQISMAEISLDPVDLTFRLWGTKLTDWWGFDYTNKSFAKTTLNLNSWIKKEQQYIADFAAEPKFGMLKGTLAEKGHDYHWVTAVDLPLGADGKVTHMLSAYRLVD